MINMKKVKKMAFGGMGSPAPANMPPQSNAGGAMRGPDRAAAMSGRTFPNAPVAPAPAPVMAAPAAVVPAAADPRAAGLARAAAMSGRTMPVAGTGMRPAGMKKGGSVSSASKRADGCAQRGKTKGKVI